MVLTRFPLRYGFYPGFHPGPVFGALYTDFFLLYWFISSPVQGTIFHDRMEKMPAAKNHGAYCHMTLHI